MNLRAGDEPAGSGGCDVAEAKLGRPLRDHRPGREVTRELGVVHHRAEARPTEADIGPMARRLRMDIRDKTRRGLSRFPEPMMLSH